MNVSVELRPVGKDEVWCIEFADGDVRLLDGQKRRVLMVPRDHAVQYIRIERDVLRGWLVSLTVLEGARAFLFRASRQAVHDIVACLPHKSVPEVRKEVRLNACAIVLFAFAFLLLRDVFPATWSIALLVVGIVGLAFPDRRVYHVNALAMFTLGIAQLFVRPAPTADSVFSSDVSDVLLTVSGIVMLCWAIQQYILLSPNAQLRGQRLKQTREDLVSSAGSSRLVRQVALIVLAASTMLSLYAAYLFLLRCRNVGGVTPVDWVSAIVIAGLCLVSGGVLAWRPRRAYLEARVALQMVVAVVLLVLWGLVSTMREHGITGIPTDLFSQGFYAFARPYAWGTFLLIVVFINRWFGRAVDRELSEAFEWA